jgi:hypothetical protein
MTTVALIACSSRKNPEGRRALSARDLYTGQLFRAAWAYAATVLGLPGRDIFVLSAKHGLVASGCLLRWYDDTLVVQCRGRRQIWAAKVAAQLRARFGDSSTLTVYVLAGRDYREFLVPSLTALGAGVRLPIPAGLGYARQVAWLKAQVAAVGPQM